MLAGGAEAQQTAPVPSFLFTDVEGSTQLLRDHEADWAAIIERQRSIIVEASEARDGQLVSVAGDGCFCIFPDDDGSGALDAALAAQASLADERWPGDADVRVRMGVHAGPATCVGGEWVGLAVHQGARIGAVGHGGQIVAAADICPPTLEPVSLGRHVVKDFDGEIELVQVSTPGSRRTFPSLRTLARRRHNLPLRRTTFVGREREQSVVDKLLDENRLVTVVGPGGVGKTRLAVETAGERMGRHADGTFLVELTPVAAGGSRAAVVAAMAEPGQSRSTAPLVEILGDRAVLLVLDNCEHLIDDVAEVVDEVLDHCENVHVIATSREALGLRGEAICTLGPLAIPAHDAVLTVDAAAVMEHAATRLLFDRAHLVRPDLELDAGSAQLLVQVCRRLDGLPLAIELAAARLGGHSLAELDARLADHFDVLDGARRSGPTHQRTLDALVGWSYDLLDDDEARVLRRLSVFAGACGIDAAEAVCGGPETRALLDRLVTRSLVQADGIDGTTRYRLLETVRVHARRRLAEAGDEDAAFADHALWFAGITADCARRLVGPEQAAVLTMLSLELDEIRRALRTMIEQGWGDEACALAGNLRSFWMSTGTVAEGRRWLGQTLALPADGPTRGRARALQAAGWLALDDDDLDAAEPLMRECVTDSENTGDDRCRAQALDGLARIALARGDLGAAEDRLEQSLTLRRNLGIPVEISAALNNLAGVVAEYDVERAAALVEESLDIDRAGLAPTAAAISLRNLGLLRWQAADVEGSRAAWLEARDLARSSGDRRLDLMLAHDLSRCAEALDDLEGAAALVDEALAVAISIDGTRKRPPLHLDRARLARRLGDPRAAREHAQLSHDLGVEVGDLSVAEEAAAELESLAAEAGAS